MFGGTDSCACVACLGPRLDAALACLGIVHISSGATPALPSPLGGYAGKVLSSAQKAIEVVTNTVS